MLRFIPAVMVLSLACLGAQAEIYKVKDARGNITFTDTPGEQPAQVVELKTVNTQPAISPGTVPEEAKPGVQSVYSPKILSPKEGATLPQGQHDLPVVANVSPALGETDALQLTIDGSPYGDTTRNNSFTLRDIPQGEHNLRVNVVSLEGKVLSSSPSVRIFVLPEGAPKKAATP